MAYQLVNTSQGQFAIDWDTCTRIIRNCIRARKQLQHAKIVKESQVSMNPMTWGLPDLEYVDVNWDKVKEETLTGTWGTGLELASKVERSVENVAFQLKAMQAETHKLQNDFKSLMRLATHRTMMEIEKSTATYGRWVDGLKLTRDLSGAILIGISTAGVGVAADVAIVGAGAGTIIKTTAKYQDTGSVGLAAVEAASNIVFTIIPAGRGVKLAGNAKMVKIIISAGTDTWKGILEGKSVGEAALAGSLNFAAPSVGKMIAENGVVQAVLSKTAVPVLVRVLSDDPDLLREVSTEVTKKLAEEMFKKGGKAASGAVMHPKSPAALQDPMDTDIGDSLTFEDNFLLKFAIVDMEKGIGRSAW